MSKAEVVQWLSWSRALIAAVAIPFAVRARMWFLTTGWISGLAASVCLAAGGALWLVGVIGIPLYGLWGIHTLRVTQRRRTEPYFRRSK